MRNFSLKGSTKQSMSRARHKTFLSRLAFLKTPCQMTQTTEGMRFKTGTQILTRSYVHTTHTTWGSNFYVTRVHRRPPFGHILSYLNPVDIPPNTPFLQDVSMLHSIWIQFFQVALSFRLFDQHFVRIYLTISTTRATPSAHLFLNDFIIQSASVQIKDY